jgi:hypothetical protein
MKTLEERYKDAQDAVKQAELEVGFRKKQLSELRPKRQEYEELSLSKFNVQIQKIDEYILGREKEGETLVESLELELEKAKQVT